MIKFEAGKTYYTRSIGCSDAIFTAQIVSRTAKTVKTSDGKTFRVSENNGAEFFMPDGRYSMAPVMRANRVQASKSAVADERNTSKDTRTVCGVCKVTHPTREAARVCYDSCIRALMGS